MIDRKVFASRLYSLRNKSGLTQKQLGEKLGAIKQTVNNWERCVSVPSLDIAAALADFFDVSIDYLVGRSDDPSRL